MIIRAVIYCHVLLIYTVVGGVKITKKYLQRDVIRTRCLTGYMTDIQSWVDEFGRLTRHIDVNVAVNVSNRTSVVKNLENGLTRRNSSQGRPIKYLSMANCQLIRVPSVFRMEDNQGRRLADTIEYLTLYGNNFGTLDPYPENYNVTMNATNARELRVPELFQRRILRLWAQGFQNQSFRHLKELDLRACSIQVLGDYAFQTMPELRSLYLGENNIFYIEVHAFDSMRNLRHLDISRNRAYGADGNLEDLEFENLNVFRHLKLESLDSSFTNIGMANLRILRHAIKTLKRLSLCYSGLGRLSDDTFYETSLRILDVSGNPEILSSPDVLRGIEGHLEVLYAENVSLKNMEVFRNFSRLEILNLSNNGINIVPENVARSLKNLRILDLDNNRITSWNNNKVSLMSNLKLLSLKNNNINIITREMFYDLENLSFLGLSGNFLVCNCHARDLFEVALNNELRSNITYFKTSIIGIKYFITYHTGFEDFNNIIRNRNNITVFCEHRKECNLTFNENITGNYLLLDYEDYLNQYRCLSVSEGISTALYNVKSCAAANREANEKEDIILLKSWNRYLLLLIPAMLLPLLLFAFVFRKNFKYFLITVRNSAMLSLINKNDSADENKDFCYDVFVSYCNEDRAWVLDKLLPHVEKDCNISVCLHERDFQVGLSILENIVSCMDRSRMIMLIISKRFLLSQWCQFEMHLAQHRLLETRREDLILVLLEEIPRRLRPNTLHYLMLTKTYIVWPEKEVSEQSVFWRRMKKSLVTHKLKSTENMSLA